MRTGDEGRSWVMGMGDEGTGKDEETVGNIGAGPRARGGRDGTMARNNERTVGRMGHRTWGKSTNSVTKEKTRGR